MRLYVLSRRRFMVCLLAFAACASVAASMLVQTVGSPSIVLDRELITRLNMIFSDRAQSVIQGDAEALASHYDLESRYGRWAFDREQRRIRYVEAWSRARAVRFVGTTVEISVDSAEVKGDAAWLRLRQSAEYAYIYDADPTAPPDRFGIGTRHFTELVRRDGAWVIRRDWYTDPLDEDSVVGNVRPAIVSDGILPATVVHRDGQDSKLQGLTVQAGVSASPGEPESTGPPGLPSTPRYDRDRAVAYADEYCGSAWGCGNNREYNPMYKDFTGLGGDCSNFVSQVLGDPEAGRLPMDWTWRYTFRGSGAGASRAWAQAEALAGFLINSGRAVRVARGTYPDVVSPSEKLPYGPIGALHPGDVIAYEERGRIEHMAVVTGTDSHGYVVVNSHTADRYHVPWDLGWDRGTVFWLLKIVW
ncbi:MAG: amidase domain-containing protein [Bacillota bacterium]|nr:amidase domain-containing protein [Bacillota bacterium]